MKRSTAILLFVVGIGAIGVYYYYNQQVAALRNLTYKLIGFSIGDLSQPIVQANLIFRIYSSSTIDAQVNGLNLDVYINGARLGNIQNTTSFIIPANGYSDVPLTVTFSPAVLASDAVSVLTTYLTSSDMLIALNGYVSVKSAFLNVSVPVNYSTTLKEVLSS
jgi:LEA14-like dessication related protein